MDPKQPVAFEFECVDLPGRTFGDYQDVHLALQEGKAIVQEVAADVERAIFRFTLQVQPNKEDGSPNWTGPCAQGGREDRFVYLCWGERRAGVWAGFRRAKVPLNGIRWQAIRAAVEADAPLRARISMTNGKGEPVAASLKKGEVVWQE